MYRISQLSNKIENTETGEIFLNDDRELLYHNYLEWLKNDGTPDIVDCFDSEASIYRWDKDLDSETEKYIKRTNDGREAYAKISAEFRLAKLNNIITEEGQKFIEQILIPVRNEVLAGQWISALQILKTIDSSSIGGVLYNRLFNQITNYINENY